MDHGIIQIIVRNEEDKEKGPLDPWSLIVGSGSEEAFDRDENLVADALIAEANQLEGVAQLLSRWFEGFIRFVEQELQREYPKARPSQRRAAALGIVSTFLVMGSLRPMTNSAQHRRAARRAADQLVETLGTGPLVSGLISLILKDLKLT